MRIRFQPHEKAAIFYIRKHHQYSINHLADFFGRSTSIIHQVLNFNRLIGNLPNWQNLRKIPNQTRKQAALNFRFSMEFWIEKWMPFILGEEDKPP